MSRSYKKNPITKDRYGSKSLKFFKRQANKKIRNSDEQLSDNQYKKQYESWTIHDYKSRYSYEEYIKQWNDPNSWLHEKFTTLEEAIYWWKKTNINK